MTPTDEMRSFSLRKNFYSDSFNVSPASTGKLAKERARIINERLHNFARNLISDFNEYGTSSSLLVKKYGNETMIYNAGIYYVPFSSIPVYIGVFVNFEKGEIYIKEHRGRKEREFRFGKEELVPRRERSFTWESDECLSYWD